jgi:hypothetical protein
MNKLAALAVCGIALLAAPPAHADTSVEDLICQEMRMGFSDDQITASIHAGQPTMPAFIVRGKVLNTLGLCEQSTP